MKKRDIALRQEREAELEKQNPNTFRKFADGITVTAEDISLLETMENNHI